MTLPPNLRLTAPAAAAWLAAMAAIALPTAATPAVLICCAALALGAAAAAVHASRPPAPPPHPDPAPAVRNPAPHGRTAAPPVREPVPEPVPGAPGTGTWARRAGVHGRDVTRGRSSGAGPPGRAPARLLAAVLVCAAAGGVSGAVRVRAVHAMPVAAMAARHAGVRADLVVTGSTRPLPACPGTACRPRTLVPARLVRLRGDTPSGRAVAVRLPVLVIAGADAVGLAVGQPFTAYGRLSPARPGELLAAVVLVRGRVASVRAPPAPYALAQAVRERLRAHAAVLPQPARGLLPAIVVGDRTGVPQETNDQFLAAGMTHLLAVSGANLAILAAAIAGVARLLRRPVVAALAALPATALFVLVAGPEPSVLRAAVMGTIASVALAAGRERSGLHTLSVAVLALVLFDPELALSYAFALSTLATAGILVLGPRITDRLGTRLPRWAATALAVPIAAELACAPIVAMMASRVSLVAVPANLVADPLVAPATVLGALVAALGPVAPGAAGVLVWPAGCAVAGIAWVARVAAAVPHATIAWPGGVVGAVSLLAAIIAAVLLVRRLRRRHRALIITAVLTVFAVAVAFRVAAPGWPARHWLLTACDVGQGDGLALATGDGGAVVVDTGPRPDLMDACLRRLSVTRVPLIVLTHFHADHAGGVDGVLRGRRVGAVLASPYHVPAEGYDHVARALAARRIPLWTPAPGWRARVGTIELTVLGPAPETAREASAEGDDAGPNDASVVLYARDGPLTALLTGDVEPPAQDALLAAGVPRAQVLKVPHHGSANQDPAFLAAPGARAAIISVGRDNGYGHPAPRTVDRLRGLGIAVYRTDTDGDVQVSADGRGGLVTSARRAPP